MISHSKKQKGFIMTKNFMARNQGEVLKKYKYERQIANGQFGEIYLVTHILTQQKRCIKVYNRSRVTESAHNEFEDETELLMNMDHPNILKMYESFKDKDKYYLVTEYLEGGDLFDFITKANNFTEKTASVIIEQILSAVFYLHKHGLVHRDLKPENIILASPGDINSIKLIDFGTCRRLSQGIKLNSPLGTCYYMAPEMFLGSYDQKVDIWAVGVIMHVLLVGYPPFNGENDNEIARNIVQKPITFFYDEWSQRSPASINLLMNMLTKDPSARIPIQHIFQHEWFKRHYKDFPVNLTTSTFNKLRMLTCSSKLEKAIRVYLVYLLDLREQEKDLFSFFRLADKNRDGVLDSQELIDICIESNFFLDGKKYLDFADLNCDGKINYSEFLITTMEFKKKVNRKLLKKIFIDVDLDADGYLSKREAIHFFNLNNETNFIDELFDEVDGDNDNLISLNEFLNHLEKIK